MSGCGQCRSQLGGRVFESGRIGPLSPMVFAPSAFSFSNTPLAKSRDDQRATAQTQTTESLAQQCTEDPFLSIVPATRIDTSHILFLDNNCGIHLTLTGAHTAACADGSRNIGHASDRL